MTVWQTTRFQIDLSQPRIMGIVNVTPDSFSDGGDCVDPQQAIAHAESLIQGGAHILDVGGESTRPGAAPVSAADEWSRIGPVLKELLTWRVPISVDTYKPSIMQRALDMGVDIINDVWALRRTDDAGLRADTVVSNHPNCGVCLMHMHREPATMQVTPMEGDVVHQVRDFLHVHAQALLEQGVSRQRVVLDYGIGFGKTVEQNCALLARQNTLLALGFPLLAGWSRKSTLGAITGHDNAKDRLAASLAAALMAVERGARVLRVHDVLATADALKVWQAVAGVKVDSSTIN
jgi:dihydropteroate synthase